MPASWRTDSSDTGGGAVAGDGEAIGVTVRQRDSTQRHIVRHLLPAQGLGVPCAPGINDRRVTHNMCCVMSRKHSCMPTSPRSSHNFVGASGLVSWHRSGSAMTIYLTPRRQSVGRGLRRDGNMGALGRPARSLPPWCQTNLVLPVSSVVSVRCNAACEMEAVRKWPISRLLPIVLAGRSLAG